MPTSINGSTGGGASAPAGTGVVTATGGAFVDPVPSAATTRATLGVDLLRWMGAWSVATAYVAGDGVTSGGSTWRALRSVTGGSAPSEGADWTVFASKGSTGDTGATGPQGPQGEPGSGTWLSLYEASALYVGGESAFGFAQADYITASAAAAVPLFGPGQSLVVCVYPGATPTGVEIVACHASGASNRGWVLDFGRNAGARRQCGLYLFGMNASAGVQLTGSEFTVGSAYVIAVTILADKSVRYSVNGGSVATIAALSGTYVPPTSGDTYDLGSTRAFVSLASYYPLTSALIGEVRTYSTEISDADLVAACAGRTTGTIPDVATGTVSTRFLPSDFAGGRRVKAQTGVTWILKGGASIAPV
jgi:hypothetical protein